MRKTFNAALVIAAMGSMSLASCHFGQGETAVGADSLSYSMISFEDSVTESGNIAYQSILVQYPVAEDNSVLADSVRYRLAADLRMSCFPRFGEEQDVAPRFGGSLTDGEALVRFFGDVGLQKMREAITPEGDDMVASAYGNDYNAAVVAQTRNYVTYDFEYGVFTGGAHGLQLNYQMTFRNSDGHVMGWELVDTLNARPFILQGIEEGLLDYFGEGGTGDKASIREYLFLFDDPSTPDVDESQQLPLPATAPSLTPEGVRFVYQQYEIAAYAYGRPSCIIPWEKAKAFLTPDAKQLAGI